MSASMLVELDHLSRFCLLKTNEGTVVGTYPFVWLRDNCRCSKCYHPSSNERTIFLTDLDIDIVPDTAEVDGETLNIKWPGGHLSAFPISWLKEFQFSNMSEDPVDAPVRQLWGKEMQEMEARRISFADILNNDKSLYDWMEALQIYGLAIITDAPKKPGAILEIGKRVSFLKITQYGETFQLISEFEARNLGWTGQTLAFHSDLPYLINHESIMLLHAIRQPTGTGENVKARGRNDENYMENGERVKENGERVNLKRLDKAACCLRRHGRQHRLWLSPDGSIKCIRFGNGMRAPYMRIPVQDVHKAYKAITKFNAMLYNDMIRVKLAPGEIGCFDNNRVLHGRSGFTITDANNSRHVEGGYIDWDQARSRMRIIREKMLDLKPL
ncbi:gamma-butyrobetaine dioxygenase-like [Amphiura filiformis]|uniref:gamma-butyrobetaine dioxygenase-like n=1 Tax=Amphiura filiformis TaxID=82378 RepID=UPI003B221649